MTTTIDARVAVQLIRDEVTFRGSDFRYKDNYAACMYMPINPDTGVTEPGCIVGGALFRQLGMENYDKYDCEGTIASAAPHIGALNDTRFTDAAILVLTAAQAAQDSGSTHGQAETSASRMYEAIHLLASVSDE